jgi:hypothetical protein
MLLIAPTKPTAEQRRSWKADRFGQDWATNWRGFAALSRVHCREHIRSVFLQQVFISCKTKYLPGSTENRKRRRFVAAANSPRGVFRKTTLPLPSTSQRCRAERSRAQTEHLAADVRNAEISVSTLRLLRSAHTTSLQRPHTGTGRARSRSGESTRMSWAEGLSSPSNQWLY